ncbi:MAG: phenylalanine--tRNA ligase subunit alpha [bacterium]|nr:phenylalanine--tRNA ligase subunit alpha [bacterium]
MKDDLQKLLALTLDQLAQITDVQSWDKLKFEVLDKKDSEYAKLSMRMRELSKEERPTMGLFLNQIKAQLDSAFVSKNDELKKRRYAQLESSEKVDMTFPVNLPDRGHIHPVTQAYYEIIDIFSQIGFSFAEGPEVEWFWHAFEALNMPSDHPASDDFETYYVSHVAHSEHGRMLLRPHTSPVQIRTMLSQKPPIRVVVPGKTYRPNYDTSHTPMFHQFEGLLIDRNVSIGHLVGTLDYFVKKFFGDDLKVRIRPYHFQFTEPSFEVDISCTICKGEGCRLCKEGWLELGGAGMVHPNVLINGGIDPKEFNGFAFGWGIERCLSIRSGIPDIRMIYEGELKLLEQF